MDFKELVVNALKPALAGQLDEAKIAALVETPKSSDLGDYAFPTFSLAKILHRAPKMIASDLVEKIDAAPFEQVKAVGGYVNFYLDKISFAHEVLKAIAQEGEHYGDAKLGKGNVPIDMSSPNIAKPMSMGHLRSTVIGNALANILAKVGYSPIKINHLGDWGTQFGKLIVAYKKWGSEAAVKADPIKNLLHYYVQFHEEAEKDPELEGEARAWFKRLEDGDDEALTLWRWFRTVSLAEFNRIYKILGVDFDSYNGEAFYNDKMDSVVKTLEDKHLLKTSQGAEIVDLSKYNLNPALIKKSDGATLYMTRDLAAAIFRKNHYHFVQSLYVVGNEQREHFQQLKAVLLEMGYEWANDIHHIPFGLITANGKKLSTRRGNIILLEKVLNDAVDLAKQQIAEKHPDLPNAQKVAHEVGVGAVIFHDLKNERLDNFDFNLEEVVRFEGETGPYVQYTNARAHSILRKADIAPAPEVALGDPAAWDVLRALGDFPAIVARAAKEYEPSVIAKYALRLAKAFNQYYANVKVLVEDSELPARLAMVKATTQVLENALHLLGVAAPEEM
ncbi:arginine--tRNA ligase [Lacticaseibacillus casei]|jgi:arginyl-tRNA synthetase|uniref:Arginine--tRNA ligase n=1 Tax=Lacticaseibacillus huelsenbergensis TaxID=3035291 RepID=A0ABY8DQE0_9LACO|nr:MULTISPECIES: arginine--tRNA ligase [Lacticaseibacillus]MDG3060528.1 arginine--tRNA ligase [Lacticaseibacillus sp. BCRC 81376]QVI37550.1 arginine--tRNA ligase [Lacticaseibacillus casei]QXG59337.1 arginine--tRNA ligase [Lacticaseibacillus casei]WFB39205.1 arginine--tRNA ligase [Lacticaseibacillus huelsenbergensis]WFB40907.1 arginine--tRNA ligase [Lacticaseibacillus huelsenbergensis]